MQDRSAEGQKMPVLFVGHGSPENAALDNEYSQTWKAIGQKLPKPKAILCVSAHWLTMGTAVTAMEKPRTIHDFYGFPPALYRIMYPAPGSPQLAQRVLSLIKTVKPQADSEWGLDHGTWSVLKHMFPKADVPVLQLSIDYQLPLARHHQIGTELAALRKEGVLILGSGNLVHNLSMMRMGSKPFPWAVEFDEKVKADLSRGDAEALIHFQRYPDADLALPTYEHYLPLLYALGAAGKEKPQFFCESIFASSVSMRGVAYGMDSL